MSYRIRLLLTDEGWSVSCLDLPGCHSQGTSRDEALANIREAITLWLEVEAEEAGVKHVETLDWHSDAAGQPVHTGRMPPELTAVQAPMPGGWPFGLVSGAGKF
jgi:predicted RNase H-like HicB family nuclease